MSWTPILPQTGYAGWAFLQKTQGRQMAHHDQQASVVRLDAHFRDRIMKVASAEDFVKDRRLMEVALGAFGLDDDIDSRYFIRKLLEGGTEDSGAMSMRLSDTRYRDLAAAFSFGNEGGLDRQAREALAQSIPARWKARSFEKVVGEVDENIRLAMNATRELKALAEQDRGDKASWFGLMAQKPLRKVMETAFGLPASFGLLDLDQQYSVLTGKAKAAFGDGSVAQFADPARMDALVKRYLVRAQMTEMASSHSPTQVALSLLQMR